MANVINLLAVANVSAPTGLWAIILNWIESGIVNYGWVIILFTLLIKVCLSPLDLLIKFSTKKTALVQQKLAPQIARINKKFANDRTAAQMQTNALYKKEGYNMFGSCIVMVINLAVTMVVFFTILASLRTVSAYKAINQYTELEAAYTTAYTQNIDNVKQDFISKFNEYENVFVYNVETSSVTTQPGGYDNFKAMFEGQDQTGDDEQVTHTNGIFDNFYNLTGKLTEEQQAFVKNTYVVYDEADTKNNKNIASLLSESGNLASAAASKAANEKWKDVKDSWLWIANIWVADNYKSPLPSYNDLLNMANSAKNNEYQHYVKNINVDLYNVVTNSVHTEVNRWNGFFILAVLAGVTSFLSQWITERLSKPKNKNISNYVDQANPANGAMKFMKILLPALMVIFVLTSSSAFGIYIVISSIISILISTLTSLIVDACYKKKQEEVYSYLEKETIRSMKKNKK